ncbi:MAG TPA: hypothetical protein VNV85_10920 [Puia sp.]|nr:hypothetical protein [Puia sp.]
MKKATPAYCRIDGGVFQNIIRTISPKTWFNGENILKKFPGFTVLKYSLAVTIEPGILLPHDFASIKEVYIFTNTSPAARLIDANSRIVFISFYAKMTI